MAKKIKVHCMVTPGPEYALPEYGRLVVSSNADGSGDATVMKMLLPELYEWSGDLENFTNTTQGLLILGSDFAHVATYWPRVASFNPVQQPTEIRLYRCSYAEVGGVAASAELVLTIPVDVYEGQPFPEVGGSMQNGSMWLILDYPRGPDSLYTLINSGATGDAMQAMLLGGEINTAVSVAKDLAGQLTFFGGFEPS